MTFKEAVAELKAKHRRAELGLSVKSGECFKRAIGIDFLKGRGGMYAGRDADETEVLVYYNDTEHTICCTVLAPGEE
jgi:hypothetical protein